MAEPYEPERTNGIDENEPTGTDHHHHHHHHHHDKDTIYGVLHRMLSTLIFLNQDEAKPLLHRIKVSVSEDGPCFREASRNTARDVLHWTHRGSSFRALLVVSLGTITLLNLSGLLVFMACFLAAIANAIIISLLISLAAVGGFLAFFFACVTAMYIGALSVAVFVLSTSTISAIVAVLIATDIVHSICVALVVMPNKV